MSQVVDVRIVIAGVAAAAAVTAAVAKEMERAARERAERERQRRIQKELELVEELSNQRAQLDRKLQALRAEREEIARQKLQAIENQHTTQVAQIADQAARRLDQADEEIHRLEITVTEYAERHEKLAQMLDSIQRMNAQTYLMFDALEGAMDDLGQQMVLEELEEQEATWYIRFGQENTEKSVDVTFDRNSDGLLRLDITQGYQNDECHTMFDDIQQKMVFRGINLIPQSGRHTNDDDSDDQGRQSTIIRVNE